MPYLKPKSNVVIVSDKPASLEKLERYIDAEVLQAMGVPAAAGHDRRRWSATPQPRGDRRPREHSFLPSRLFARTSHIPMSGSEERASLTNITPKPTSGSAQRGYRLLEAEYKRINEFVQLANRPRARRMANARRRAHPFTRRSEKARDSLWGH